MALRWSPIEAIASQSSDDKKVLINAVRLAMPQPKYPMLFHLGKLLGLATGLLVDFGTMPFAGLALGYIVDTVIYNLWVGSDRPRRVRIPALAVIIAGATACAYSVLFLYAAGSDSGIWHMFDRVADGMAMVIPAVHFLPSIVLVRRS